VAEGVGGALAGRQVLELAVRVVGDAVVVGVDRHGAGGAGGVDRRNLQVVGRVRIGVVGGQVDGDGGAVLADGGGIGDRGRAVVLALHGDGDGGARAAAVSVGDGVAEGVGGALAGRQVLELAVRVGIGSGSGG